MGTSDKSRRIAEQQKIVAMLVRLWHSQPELRLCQLLSNVATSSEYRCQDLYYLEDEKLIEYLKAYENTTST